MGTLKRSAHLGVLIGGMALTLGAAAWGGGAAGSAPAVPHVTAETAVDAGRYLIITGQCNDCHTPGWGETNGAIPEQEQLTGSPVGFRGPWGTSYPKNLRLTVASMDEDVFVARLKAGAGLPPMPWMNVAKLAEQDMRAIYRYIRSLGPAGETMPMPLAPGVEPQTPYILFEPVLPAVATR